MESQLKITIELVSKITFQKLCNLQVLFLNLLTWPQHWFFISIQRRYCRGGNNLQITKSRIGGSSSPINSWAWAGPRVRYWVWHSANVRSPRDCSERLKTWSGIGNRIEPVQPIFFDPINKTFHQEEAPFQDSVCVSINRQCQKLKIYF